MLLCITFVAGVLFGMAAGAAGLFILIASEGVDATAQGPCSSSTPLERG